MQPFRVESGLVAPLPRADVDTDQIIPKQFLKRIERRGFGECLFFDWRSDGDFFLNQPRYRGASILVAGKNFGCGSSREHAAWALLDAGFRAIIAPSFADIFTANCTNNGIAAIAVPDQTVAELTRRAEEREGYRLTIDLERCELRDDSELAAPFAIDAFRRNRLLHGFDEIGLTLRHETAIAAYEFGLRR
ncbi:MAG TPA: 3-isopropylmalate dehydratase small subunit [Thermoanaerobaculia bacterium]|nr:3-isopropylmalate dehydratase small subunit [Thermoanaerobaculia bacterium]